MGETTNLAETAAEQESEQSGQSASSKGGRKSLEEQLADIEAQKRKLQERIKQRDRELRAQYEKDLWVLLKAEKWDEVPIEAWRVATKSISSALKSAGRGG